MSGHHSPKRAAMAADPAQQQQPTTAMGSKLALRLCKDTTDVETIVALTRHDDPAVRQRALREICPCRVKSDVDEFWRRVMEMVDDESPLVRQQVGFWSLSLSGLN